MRALVGASAPARASLLVGGALAGSGVRLTGAFVVFGLDVAYLRVASLTGTVLAQLAGRGAAPPMTGHSCGLCGRLLGAYQSYPRLYALGCVASLLVLGAALELGVQAVISTIGVGTERAKRPE